MKLLMPLLSMLHFLFAGQTSLWSDPFVLQMTAHADLGKPQLVQQPELWVYPNPFSTSVQITVGGVNSARQPTLKIFASDGRMVADLSGEFRPNPYKIYWNATGPAGIYLARLTASGQTRIRTIVMLK